MKRREFSTALACSTAMTSFAQQSPFLKGRDFSELGKRAAIEAPANKIEVADFFWYSCPHCNAFEPMLEAWIAKLPSDVQIRRVPVHFRDDFEPQQRLYFTLEAMGKVAELHGKVFDEIHQRRNTLTTNSQILAWVETRREINAEQFKQLFNSFSVVAKAKRAKITQDEYALGGVPALGVAGKYYTDGSLAQNMSRALQVVDMLIQSERAIKARS